MSRAGFTVEAYIDDFVCVGIDRLSCQACYDALIALIQSLGLEVNWHKAVGPYRCMTFLGVYIDCVERTLSLPLNKLADLKKLLVSFAKRTKVTKVELQRVLGKLNWASRVIKGGRVFMRRLIDLSCKVRESFHYVRLGTEAKEDLNWWLQCLELFNGTCIFKCDAPLPNYFYATDACETGGGGFCGTDWFHVNWAIDYPSMVGRHINELELFIAVLALERWGPKLAGCHVKIQSDNVATVSSLNKTTSRSAALMPHIRNLFWLGVKFDVTVSSVHIPGSENILADRISRLDSFSEACEARLILAGFASKIVFCVGHISIPSFIYLQGLWMRGLNCCAGRQTCTNAVP